MAHSYADAGGMTSFTVVKSNPSGNIVRFTITDTANKLTTVKMIRAVLHDAIQQWINSERADLNTNGDSAVAGQDVPGGAGDGFTGGFNYVYASKYAEIELTALTSISSTGNLTAAIPYADVH